MTTDDKISITFSPIPWEPGFMLAPNVAASSQLTTTNLTVVPGSLSMLDSMALSLRPPMRGRCQMEKRETVHRVIPPRTEPEIQNVQVTRYFCDFCGSEMLAYNWPDRDPDAPVFPARNTVFANLSRENSSGSAEGSQYITRHYCDDCLPGIWPAIDKLLALPPVT